MENQNGCCPHCRQVLTDEAVAIIEERRRMYGRKKVDYATIDRLLDEREAILVKQGRQNGYPGIRFEDIAAKAGTTARTVKRRAEERGLTGKGVRE